ncbi:uncharacterized protein LOC130522972 isoform X1 [Takifugu flavidus]|uniref:uncharacterized protein LOC130522972 isoform X1 n=1 Tax=Takifugu flavidus TaxID=433684 RepID=UPI0025441659|nr:uncharacterized protein LOC130522972 isoform X1 [Takifugu flavidus]
MDIYNDENEYSADHIPMFQKVVDMFEGKPDFQRIVRLGILANLGYNVEYEDAEDYDFSPYMSGVHSHGFGGNRASSSSPQRLPHSGGATNASAGILGASREAEKAEKKRLKRQKRKERKRNEQQEKEKQTEDDENKPGKEKSKVGVKEQAAAKDTDGSGESEDELSDEDLNGFEELDMASTFVSKARSKLEQKPKPEKEKKTTAKEPKPSPEKPNRAAEAEEKDSSHPGSHTVEENIRISAELANKGNIFAGAGNFKKAVQYYTDAIKRNPTEYKLFGNRSFCFERMRLYMKALDDAELSLSMRPGWVKGLFRKGRALMGLKRYEEAERAFRQILAEDSSCPDATQELFRVQIAQLREYGYTYDESVHALNTHKSVRNALQFLTSFNHQPANLSSASSLKPHGDPALQDKPSRQTSPQQKELYPVWVGNLFFPVTEDLLEQLFSKVGPVCSVRLLTQKRCAFVNFTKRQDCEQAIRRFHGFNFNGTELIVRYPDRIPSGMGFSKAALTSDDPHEHYRGRDAAGSRREAPLYRSASKH